MLVIHHRLSWKSGVSIFEAVSILGFSKHGHMVAMNDAQAHLSVEFLTF
jgi:hypothetical protein